MNPKPGGFPSFCELSVSGEEPAAPKATLAMPSKGQKAPCHLLQPLPAPLSLTLLSIHSFALLGLSLGHKNQHTSGRIPAPGRSGRRRVLGEPSRGALQHSGPQETIAGLSHPKGSKSRSLATTSGKWQTTRHCHRPAVGRSLVSDALQAVSLEAKSQKASSLLRAAPLGPGQRLLPCTHDVSLQTWAHLTIWSCEEGSSSTVEPSPCGTRPQLQASGGCFEYCQCHLEVGLEGQV